MLLNYCTHFFPVSSHSHLFDGCAGPKLQQLTGRADVPQPHEGILVQLLGGFQSGSMFSDKSEPFYQTAGSAVGDTWKLAFGEDG